MRRIRLKKEEIKINLKSSLKDIYNFVKIKLNFPEKAIEATQEQDLDEEVFSLYQKKTLIK